MGRLLARLILVPLGVVLGAAAAVFMLVTLGLEHLTHAAKRNEIDVGIIGTFFSLANHARGLSRIAALAPALLVVVVGEVARIRSALFYIAGCGAALVAIPLVASIGEGGKFVLPATKVLQVFATAGFAGGLVYWLVAGRGA